MCLAHDGGLSVGLVSVRSLSWGRMWSSWRPGHRDLREGLCSSPSGCLHPGRGRACELRNLVQGLSWSSQLRAWSWSPQDLGRRGGALCRPHDEALAGGSAEAGPLFSLRVPGVSGVELLHRPADRSQGAGGRPHRVALRGGPQSQELQQPRTAGPRDEPARRPARVSVVLRVSVDGRAARCSALSEDARPGVTRRVWLQAEARPSVHSVSVPLAAV